MPTIIDKYLHVSQPDQWGTWFEGVTRYIPNRYGAQPRIIVIHVQQGTNNGSWQHFHAVSASATVLIGKNGDIWRLVPEQHGPWTNGDVNNPTALGREIIQKFGADPNVVSLTIECEGYTNNMPLTGAQMDSVVWQVATWQKQYGIPDRYVIRHADINQVDRPYCPNPNFFNEVKRRLADAAVDVEPIYAKPSIVETSSGPWAGVHDVTVNSAVFHADKRTVTVNVDGLKRRLYASSTSAETAVPFKNDAEIAVLGWVNGERVEGESRWWIASDYSRIWVGGTKQKPEDANDDEPDALPEGVKIVNGHVYYPMIHDGRSQKVNIVGRANLRSAPSMKAAVSGIVDRGEEKAVRYWTFGDEVKGERIWYLIHESGDPFKNPKHLWAASTAYRPN